MMQYISKEIIEKGWSKDKKYCVTDENLQKYLLRVSSIEEYDRKKQEYDLAVQVAATGIPMCRPIAFGICEEGVYSVQSWIDGVDAEETIPQLSEQAQYAYGFEAGQILKKIHTIPAPEDMEPWEVYFNRKADYKINQYKACPIQYKGGDHFIEYINSHRELLKGRPRTYQHGDYHIGNMMIGTDGQLYIIDFDRNDFGDPWEEFNRIVWGAQASPAFATGMVNGYFDNQVPHLFWELLALYISSNTLGSVPWAIPFGEEQINVMLRQAEEVLSWYDNMQNVVPTWYQGIKQSHTLP